MNCTRSLIVACTIASAVVSPLAIQSTHAAPPVILSTSTTATTLTISGNNLLPGTASVTLGAFSPLTVAPQTATQLVATLPAVIPAGSYTLTVQIGNKANNSAQSVVTIGAVGSQGPKGDPGLPGTNGTNGAPGVGALRVLDSLDQQVGYFDGFDSVTLFTNGLALYLRVGPTGFQDTGGPLDIYYESLDCSGEGFVSSSRLEAGAVVAAFSPGVRVNGGNVLVLPDSFTTHSIRSMVRFASSGCGQFSSPTDMAVGSYTVIPLSPLGFIPPFRVSP